MGNAPEVVQLGKTFMCTYCACDNRSRLATHTVDGTSVCRAHVAEVIAWAQSKRAVPRDASQPPSSGSQSGVWG